jgi:hypothetical protein
VGQPVPAAGAHIEKGLRDLREVLMNFVDDAELSRAAKWPIGKKKEGGSYATH